MFIKSVILDGFKSYGKRTEINGFDPEFTAITGLNGTGKSNVLDAICFVLGISNLTQVFVFLLYLFTILTSLIERRFVLIPFKSLFSKVVRPALLKQPLQYSLTIRILINVQLVMKNAEKFLLHAKSLSVARINTWLMEKLFWIKKLQTCFVRFS